VTPISTLSEWTDVLRLSTKWGFEHLRAAAITAILPLASAVDKLVLGRTYGFADWMPGAYMDLLKRAEDLTVAEARRMDVEDIVAVAKGRREARTQNVRPDKDIADIVNSLVHVPAPVLPASSSTLASSPEEVSSLCVEAMTAAQPDMDPVSFNPKDRTKISRWVHQMSLPSAAYAAQECLVKFMQEDRTRVPLVLDMVLTRGLTSFAQALAQGRLHDNNRRRLGCENTWDGAADGHCFRRLFDMHAKDTTLGLINSSETEKACFRLADHWRGLTEMVDSNVHAHDWLATPTGKSVINTLTYLRYLHDGPYSPGYGLCSVIGSSAFSAFWVQLTSVFKSAPSGRQLALARRTNALLKKIGALVSKLAVSSEMDTFYLIVEEMRDAAKGSGNHELVPLFEVSRYFVLGVRTLIAFHQEIISDRNWPST
jgi:hypothetical protein